MAFKEFFVSYGKFHNNIVNKLIHIVFIPTIVYCIIGTSHYYPITDINIIYEKLDIGLILCTVLPLIYISQEFFSGLVTTVLLNVLYYFSHQNFIAHKDEMDYFQGVPYYWFLLYLQAFSWIMQFIGHGVFEKRAPALTSNLFSALVAPDFVVIEILYVLGYNKKAIDDAQVAIDEDLAVYWGKKEKTS
mmetsp:Transcript_24867/g.27520  ORF Transcript_24867/g.27520 Transcript_24867/m.27520 type:complete len:189 (+) Transcript_24867:10-576(+)